MYCNGVDKNIFGDKINYFIAVIAIVHYHQARVFVYIFLHFFKSVVPCLIYLFILGEYILF